MSCCVAADRRPTTYCVSPLSRFWGARQSAAIEIISRVDMSRTCSFPFVYETLNECPYNQSFPLPSSTKTFRVYVNVPFSFFHWPFAKSTSKFRSFFLRPARLSGETINQRQLYLLYFNEDIINLSCNPNCPLLLSLNQGHSCT